MMHIRIGFYCSIFLLVACNGLMAEQGNPFEGLIVDDAKSKSAFPIVTRESTTELWYDKGDERGVARAIQDLQKDIERVTGRVPKMSSGKTSHGTPVIIGTLGHSAMIDSLAKSGKLDITDLKGKWESFVIVTIDNPAQGLDQALVIAGSNRRGTIYGIYELSQQLGVSPWYWWADVPPKQRKEAYVVPGRYASGEPAVKYRGIFINDEAPCLTGWARIKFGGKKSNGVKSKMYVHVFELLLRLRANYMWPGMWRNSFFEDDPMNAPLADEYGIVMGTSHHEPMNRAHRDWIKNRKQLGHEWNYATNPEGLRKFWTEGIRRNKNYETLITIGMRGDGDEAMVEGDKIGESVSLLETIIADQRKIIAEEMGVAPQNVPQLWALYKEVQLFYDHGLEAPDDVTLLWCDDNHGNLRRVPTAKERTRSGGAGIYYHFDYVGAPRSYKWINENPLPKVWEQMNMAYEYGARQIWVVNVGDIKPMEVPIEFFLTMAWNPESLPKERIGDFTKRWAAREFGPEHADAIADIVSKYAKYNGWRKIGLLEPDTFSFTHYQEAERVLKAWQEIAGEAERINRELPEAHRDAFYQLVLYPAKACATVVELFITVGQNHLYAEQGRASAADRARHAQELFARDQELTDGYHSLADGKWERMMSQAHIGFTGWQAPGKNVMPKLAEVKQAKRPPMGVAIEGSRKNWLVPEAGTPTLPPFDELNRQTRWIDVFRCGDEPFDYTAKVDQPWVVLSETTGTVDQDRRLYVSVDWDKAPVGEHKAKVTIARQGGEHIAIALETHKSDTFTRDNVRAFGGLTGPIAFSAASTSRRVAAGDVRWEEIPDFGRGKSGIGIFPVTAQSVVPPMNAPRLEYEVFIANPGNIQVDLISGVALNVQPDRGVRVAVSLNDQKPQILDVFANQERSYRSYAPAIRDWDKWVNDNAITLTSNLTVSKAGVHTLKIWMVDPGLILQNVIIHDGDLPKSYFGPLFIR